MYVRASVRASVRACVHVRACACVRACVCACVRACMWEGGWDTASLSIPETAALRVYRRGPPQVHARGARRAVHGQQLACARPRAAGSRGRSEVLVHPQPAPNVAQVARGHVEGHGFAIHPGAAPPRGQKHRVGLRSIHWSATARSLSFGSGGACPHACNCARARVLRRTLMIHPKRRMRTRGKRRQQGSPTRHPRRTRGAGRRGWRRWWRRARRAGPSSRNAIPRSWPVLSTTLNAIDQPRVTLSLR